MYIIIHCSQANADPVGQFSAIASLEGQHALSTGNLVSLSEQQLVDCDTGSDGCNGGDMRQAILYIANAGGVESEDDYPYTGQDDQCYFDNNRVAATCIGYRYYKNPTEEALKNGVATVGPFSVAIHAGDEFQSYSGGVFDDPDCEGDVLNHGVTVIGYGNQDGKDYWLVKNSWGRRMGRKWLHQNAPQCEQSVRNCNRSSSSCFVINSMND